MLDELSLEGRPGVDVAATWIVLRTPDRGPDLRMLWPSHHYGVLAGLTFAPATPRR